MEKIRWTEHERDLVIMAAVEYYNSGTYSPIAAIRQAQVVLAPHRRRKLLSHSAAPDLIKELKVRSSG